MDRIVQKRSLVWSRKQEVGRRLSLGALNVGYNDSTVCHQGPFPASATLSAATGSVKVTFTQQVDGGALQRPVVLDTESQTCYASTKEREIRRRES